MDRLIDSILLAILGAGFGFAVWLVVVGIVGIRVLPRLSVPKQLADESARSEQLRRLTLALVLGLAVSIATRWWVAGAAVAVGIVLFWGRVGSNRSVAHHTKVAEAVASWTEMVYSVIAGGGGIEKAVEAAARVAPPEIRDAARRLAIRSSTMPLDEAMAGFAADIDHPAADSVAIALALASRQGASDLTTLLRTQAESTRAQVQSSLEVEASRARFRTGARMVMAVTVLMAAGLWAFSREYLDFYTTFSGQIALLLVGAAFLLGFWLMLALADTRPPDRFFTGSAATGRDRLAARSAEST